MEMDYKSLFKNLLKMIISGIIAMGVCYICAAEYDKYIHLAKIPCEAIKITFVAIVCLCVYVPLNLLFKMEYAGELYNRFAEKFIRK